MKPRYKKILIITAIVAVLAAAFWWGGNAPGSHGWSGETTAATDNTGLITTIPSTELPGEELSPTELPEGDPSEEGQTNGPAAPSVNAGSDDTATQPEANQSSGEEAPASSQTTLTCTLSVRCDTILEHMDYLDEAKRGLIPSDGVIFAAQSVSFNAGESVLDVLLRELQAAGIPMEYVNTPGYGSAYIEGINNIYELDCGSLSGWMYRVNGVFPSYGCSLYLLEDGDMVEILYTCDLGADIGGSAATGVQ